MNAFTLFVFLAAQLPFSLAWSSLLSTPELLSLLPNCSVICLEKAVLNSTCSPLDQQCVCESTEIATAVNLCVGETCTIKESLSTLNITSVACNAPVRDRHRMYDNNSNIFGTLSTACVLLRLLSRYLSDSQFWIDDYVIVATLFAGIPSSIINVHGLTTNGLGRDIWKLSFKNITDMMHVFFAAEMLYFTQLPMIKISICFFYLRIFPGDTVRYLIYGTIIFNALVGVSFDLVALLQCHPIDYQWKRWDGEHKGTCINNNALGFANAGISIVLDLWMLSIPMSQLLHFKLHWKKKIGVAMMFGVGFFVTIVSILRIKAIMTLSRSLNPTWDYVETGMWSTIEINVGIICACMPAIRLLLLRTFPKIIGSSQDSSNPNSNSGNKNSNSHNRSIINANVNWRKASAVPEEGRSSEDGIVYSKGFDVRYSGGMNTPTPPGKTESEVELANIDRFDGQYSGGNTPPGKTGSEVELANIDRFDRESE